MTTKTLPSKPGKREPERFTRMLAVDTVPEAGLDIDLNATAAECAALAETCGLAGVREFEAKLHVEKVDRVRFRVTGRLQARVTQTCVVSLEPFESVIEASIDVDFAPLGHLVSRSSDQKILGRGSPAATLPAGQDPPDPIIDGKIDLGALATEFLVLNLDVYPRKPGVTFHAQDSGDDDQEENSPFAILRSRS
ncbi:MAG TPA: DUF177 domain-containing protein [Methylocella sp.]|nr:DUF177 domain-containing protein [Methylocella sp.]